MVVSSGREASGRRKNVIFIWLGENIPPEVQEVVGLVVHCTQKGNLVAVFQQLRNPVNPITPIVCFDWRRPPIRELAKIRRDCADLMACGYTLPADHLSPDRASWFVDRLKRVVHGAFVVAPPYIGLATIR